MISRFLTCLRILSFAFIGFLSTSARSEISIETNSYVSLPGINITGRSHKLTSGTHTLVLNNNSQRSGWSLNAEVYQRRVEGQDFGDSIPAKLRFKAIRSKNSNSTIVPGIRISSDKTRIEADPEFGIGNFEITYEIEYFIPPFPYADHYYGVTVFSLQV